jgi:TorA maturation chaperone TorD
VNVAETTGVAVVSRLLSLGFSPPDEESLEQLRRLTVLAARTVADDGLAEVLADLELALDDDDVLDDLRPAYEALVGGAVRCAPYEASYGDPIRGGREMADVAGFYRAFGADSSGPAFERPDHVGCELEFLSFLAAKRLAARDAGDAENAAICLQTEDAFLRDHVGRWVPAFCRDMAEAAEAPIYRLLAIAGERFVALELARRGLSVTPVAPRRRTSVDGDEVTCGLDGEATAAGS